MRLEDNAMGKRTVISLAETETSMSRRSVMRRKDRFHRPWMKPCLTKSQDYLKICIPA